MITAATTLRELAFLVCTTLHRNGVTAVLSGGGAATVYAPEANQSHDLDYIFQFGAATFSPSSKPLLELGFVQRGGTFSHPETPFTLEFPAGPLMVGNDRISSWATMREAEQILHILTPTDCVRDRLCWFFQPTRDYSALEQALAVARRHPIEMDRIGAWAESERATEGFRIFESRLAQEA